MSIISKRSTILVVGVLLVIIVLGVRLRQSQKPELPDGEGPTDASEGEKSSILDSLSQEELDQLRIVLEALEFEDLGGLSEDDYQDDVPDTIGSISQEELDRLREALEALEFEDLGGLSG